MTSKSRIRGLTGWANFRLLPTTKSMSNIVNEIMTGTYFKMILESMTGSECKKVASMDELTSNQREMRVQWIIEELKAARVLAKEAVFEPKYCAIPSPDHIFELLWKLVTYDIIFIWERYDFLMLEKDDILVKWKLTWTPEVSVVLHRKVKKKVNFLAGFGGAAEKFEVEEQKGEQRVSFSSSGLLDLNAMDDALDDFDEEIIDELVLLPQDPFPSSSDMKAFKKHRPKSIPSPKDCLFEIINAILKLNSPTNDDIEELIQVADVRILVPIVNYFFGNIFTADVMLNDRWGMNLVLRTIDRLTRLTNTNFQAEDLAEADKIATCSYLCAILMLGFQYRQACAVLRIEAFFKDQMKSMQRQLNDLKGAGQSQEYFKKHVEFEKATDAIKKELDKLNVVYDIEAFKAWRNNVANIKTEIYDDVVAAMRRKFEIIKIPKTMTMNTFCVNWVVNLFLTNGVAFILVDSRQVVPRSTKLVVLKKTTGKFYENFSGNQSCSKKLYRILAVKPKDETITLAPDEYSQTMDVYMEFSGGNRRLAEGTAFLYQIFPTDLTMYIQQLITAAKNGRRISVSTLLNFFSPTWPNFINEKDPKTGESALHAAAAAGEADMVELLLENYADINIMNRHHETPLFHAMLNFRRQAAQVLAEWGCELYSINQRGDTAVGVCKNAVLVAHITDWSLYCRTASERVARDHDAGYLSSVIRMHKLGNKTFASLRSRVIAGSTLLHAAAFLGSLDAVNELLAAGVDPNVTDFKGATPLHCTTDFDIAKALLLAGADVNAGDREGNSPLHLRAFGGMVVSHRKSRRKHKHKRERSRDFEPERSLSRNSTDTEPERYIKSGLDTVKDEQLDPRLLHLLLDFSADYTIRNKKDLLPIHCAAIRGRRDIIEFLLKTSVDPNKVQQAKLLDENDHKSPSLTYLALAYGHIDCAVWLCCTAGFRLKSGEADELLEKLLIQEMILPELDAAMKFVLEQGADPNPIYVDGNSALHYAALLRDTISPIQQLVAFGGDVNRRNAQNGATPLTFACRINNIFAALALLNSGADPLIVNEDGLGPFDFVPDLDEWIHSGMFDQSLIRVFEKHILKQGRLLVHTIANRLDQHSANQSSSATPNGRETLQVYDLSRPSREIMPVNHYITFS